MSAIPVVPAWFTHRLDRSRFIAGHLRKYVAGKVLDVGCDEAHLRTLVPGIEYTGIDVGGKPDLHVDLAAPSTACYAATCSSTSTTCTGSSASSRASRGAGW
jgi:hypothetical protein